MNKKPALPAKVTDHYSNILLLAPDSQPLATIPVKRANWYKARDLVEALENKDGYSEVLRLRAEPKGRSSKQIIPLENRCVVCGSEKELSCHHVVPRAIRSFFIAREKEHTSNWCVLVCEEHHKAAEKLARPLYEKKLQEAVNEAHQQQTQISHEMVKNAIKNGQNPNELDWAAFKIKRTEAVKKAHRECAEKLIENLGGCQTTKEIFRDKFLELYPKYLPSGFLTDDWQK